MIIKRNSLDRYARAEINRRGPDYRDSSTNTAQARMAAARDATYGGTASGWWNGLIYNRDVYKLADRNRRAIAETISVYIDDQGGIDDGNIFKMLAACTLAPSFKAWTAKRFDEETDIESETADSFMQALRFAVEWYASAYASELGL